MDNFEWIEHTADVGFKAYGEDLEEAFENAALALSEIMTDTGKVKPMENVSIELEAEDLEALLFDWLNHFLYLFDAKNFIGSKFEVDNISHEDESFKLSAEAWGEKFDLGKHSQRTEVKAITYHMMEIECSHEGCYVQVIVDI